MPKRRYFPKQWKQINMFMKNITIQLSFKPIALKHTKNTFKPKKTTGL